MNGRIIGPFAQHRCETPVHRQGEGIQRLRPVEGNGGSPALAPEQDVAGIRHRLMHRFHCEERSDEAISISTATEITSLAMTVSAKEGSPGACRSSGCRGR